ncbi:serine/threonine protein kinase [Chromobacterium violaceum]|uniref:serine/threonine protein kinase n=1 Tax=Chromobacterium violaceum TaxID=536 RepID=UPI0009DA039F|nr:serine/threonine-protein kinase [Chromobacterium violaceum]MBX9265976.1 serine/threonine protein kinase [Chromobacterium violaceum]OQS50254.1 serine/threonine protein kinase [Chromobacterium violaceum]OQS52605.1 serine/threonine protein kinase [Chromobacterium violaceum]QIY80068.1 serine/threonine protein kinase [Chromobacterium violaceum]QRO32607.1 serine/threonine protein kinase [Chromobacterium violaceum]
MTQSSKQTPLPAGYRLAEYTIVRQLSMGGFSVVYLALDDDDRKFAIKEYLPRNLAERKDDGGVTVPHDLDRDAFNLGLKCFFEEGRVLSGISHPAVVRVSNFFRANQTVYMVMEYADGRSLGRELELAGGRMEERLIRKWFAALLSGLREVHSRRLLHLDIKPANIYLRRNGVPLLLDFGASRQTLARQDKHFAAMYTPGFAAPEQYDKSQPLGPWTDIYAIGACLYVCMGGATPQPSRERCEQDLLAPASQVFRHRYSRELTSLCDRCLSLEPNLRPASVLEIQKSLQQTEYSQPERPPAGEGSRLVGWIKGLAGGRHREGSE